MKKVDIELKKNAEDIIEFIQKEVEEGVSLKDCISKVIYILEPSNTNYKADAILGLIFDSSPSGKEFESMYNEVQKENYYIV